MRPLLRLVTTGLFVVSVIAGAVSVSAPAHAQGADFQRFVDGLAPAARKAGVSRATFGRAFAGVTPDPEVLKKAEYQPEFTKPIWEYLASAVSQKRIENGRKMLRQYRSVLARLETVYGVDRHVILAIWGMETSYGSFMGKKNVIRSLATLGYRGSRRKFGRTQLIAALKILQNGDTTPERMKGSWAGAMGHTQFIPTTYLAHAVDYDGDRRRDIWNSVPDALASTANYLKVSKWRTGETWGYEVVLPRGFNYASASRRTVKTLAQWQAAGVSRARGKSFPRPDDRASIILPAGAYGPAFAILNNFRSILRYNNATAYALAVGHLADRIRDHNFPGFTKPWPTEYRPLSRSQRVELQTLLAARGFLKGAADGVIGSGTRRALRAYQKARGLIVDGYPSVKLLETLRRGS
ncbi:MAG: lytic murein transglycosylase [Hyphomicrobiales bacterium]|nr:lytic murein transglycosylase [Hyphomicrobiales bacterium]